MSNILRLSLPFTVWIIGFCAVYALQGFACSRHWPPGLDARTALIAAAALFIAIQGMVLWRIIAAPSRTAFVRATAMILGAAALGAALWTSLPVLSLTVCS